LPVQAVDLKTLENDPPQSLFGSIMERAVSD
jgi:hypothetical protein